MEVTTEVVTESVPVESAGEETTVQVQEVPEVKAEPKAVAKTSKKADVKAKVAPREVPIKADEKLALRDMELNFLKAQSQVQNLTHSMQDTQRNFTQFVENLAKTYNIDTQLYIFDAVSLSWKIRG